MENKLKASALRRIRNNDIAKKTQGKWKKIFLSLVIFLTTAFFLRVWIVLLILQIGQFMLTPILPKIDDANALYASQSTIIYDREGSELYTIHGDENRFEIPFEKIPDTVKLATIAAEDDKFYDHPGFDVDGIMRAVLGELGINNFIGGGSTITQQFVKNVYLSPEKTYWRKLQELMLALKFENKFTKDEILELYLNRIPYGGNTYGIQAAAQTFFNKNAEDLSLAEAAILAALPQRPSKYSPYGQNPDFLMGSCGKIPESEIVETIQDVEKFDIKIKATGKVWLQIYIDSEIQKEGIFEQGEIYEVSFDEEIQIISGNQNFQIFVNEEEIPTNNQSNFSLSKLDFAKKTETIMITKTCDSINDPDYETGRKDYVLRRMLELGFIIQAEFDTAWQESNSIKFTPYRESIRAPHFVFFVRDILEERFGKDVVERGGLRVFTTLDPNLQEKSEELIAEQFTKSQDADGSTVWGSNRFAATNASLLAVENETGQILAMVGSRDYFEILRENGFGNDGATNLTTRPRQPGSSFKPIAYTAGLQQGYTPASVFWDVETNFGKGTDNYTPQNYDGKFMGPMSMRRSIGHSRNIPAVKMAILAGELSVVDTAHSLGIASVLSDERYGPTIALGASEAPMLEMVKAYSIFANGGYDTEFTPILKITDSSGNLIEDFTETEMPKKLALDTAWAYLMTDILSDVNARPAGWNTFLNLSNRPNAAKTGTANKKISENKILPGDVWTIGFTPQITTAVWMGNNDGTPMNTSATGLSSAAPIWKDFMEFAHVDLPVQNFKIPEGIVRRSVSKMTGKLASAATPVDQIVVETFLDSTVPLSVDDAFIEIEIDAVSEKLPTNLTPESALTKKKFINLHSERSYDPEWEKPVLAWLRKFTEEDAVFESAPTDFDNVHTLETAKYKPSINIISPVSASTVRKSSIGVWVETLAKHGVEKVEYYRDSDLVATVTDTPWKGIVPIPLNLENGAKVNITAKIFDKLFYADSSSVEVIVGEDTQAPTLRITAPQENQEVFRNTALMVRADAFDAGGDIAKVIFSLNGVQFAEVKTAPYEAPLTIRNSARLGTHTIQITAIDTAGFSVSSNVRFRVIEGKAPIDDFSIISPPDKSQFSLIQNKIEVLAQIDSAKFVAEKVDFIARNISTGDRSIFATIENPIGNSFSASWKDLTIGEYEIYFKARDVSGKTVISGRNLVKIK
jgi:penicillin-binding protein 1A